MWTRARFHRLSIGFALVFAMGVEALAQVPASLQNEWEEAKARCQPALPKDPILYSSDFKWGISLPELRAKAQEMDSSPKRLGRRAFWNTEKQAFVLPYLEENGGDVVVPLRLIQSVRKHIEAALEKGYVDGIFFPDMGHSHFYLPKKLWDSEFAPIPVPETARLYEKMMNEPQLKILYHTAEQLKTLDENHAVLPDRELQWRFHTRNLFGDNQGRGIVEIRHNPKSRANTVDQLPGHHLYSAGFNVSANEKGCFPFHHNGKLRWFDLSLFDLRPPNFETDF